jgi:hypothetical protein
MKNPPFILTARSRLQRLSMHHATPAQAADPGAADASIARRREILKRLGQTSAVVAAATASQVASAGSLARWRMDPSRRGASGSSFKLGVSS